MLEENRIGSIPGVLASQAARRFGERIALRYAEEAWSFARFDAAASRIASGLAQRLAKGARVAVAMANRPEYMLLQLAIERAGLVRVPVNARATAHEIGLILEDCGASAVFFDAVTADRVGSKSGLWSAAADSSVACGGPSFTDLAGSACNPAAWHATSLDDLCSINYTSGTSGRPKGVMLSHRNWAAVYRNMLVDRDIRSTDVVAHIGPLTHSSGAYFMPWFLRGATNIIIPGGTVDGLLDAIERFKVTVFTCVPTVLTRIVNHPLVDRYDLRSLRMIGYGAEPIPQNTLDKALRRFGPILVQNYGLTEAMMTCATLPAGEHFAPGGEARRGCIGWPYTFVEIVLRDPQGVPVAAGEVGEITVRSDHVMQGYWGMPDETAKVLRGGWLWSGDLAQMDKTGLITLAGRSKEMLISGGYNIYPQELETALTSCPDVIEAAVVGVPDPDWGEIAVAFVSLAAGSRTAPAEIAAAVKPRLGIKTPKRIEIVAELPKNANGKVDKRALQRLLAAAASP